MINKVEMQEKIQNDWNSKTLTFALAFKIWTFCAHVNVDAGEYNSNSSSALISNHPNNETQTTLTGDFKARCWKPPGHYLCIPEPGRPDCVISIEIVGNGDAYPVAISPKVTKNLPAYLLVPHRSLSRLMRHKLITLTGYFKLHGCRPDNETQTTLTGDSKSHGWRLCLSVECPIAGIHPRVILLNVHDTKL